MTGTELVRALRKLGRRRGVDVRLVTGRGKEVMARCNYGDRKAVVMDRKKELGCGLLADMLRQIGVDPRDLDR